MAAVTICSDFEAPQKKVSYCFHCFPLCLPWSDGTGCHPVVIYGCESWTIKKSERQKIDASIHQCTVLVFFFLAYFRESGKIWENGIETCKISCMKRVASPGSMHDTGCLGLVHWDDPEGWYVWGGRREKGSGWGTHVYLGRIHFDIWQN